MILLCLFAPKLYIVLFNPSKNIHTKFKTTVTSQLPKNNNHLNTLIATAVSNRQRRLTPSDYATEVTYCTSKLDVWGNSSTSDQIMQTDNGKNLNINGVCSEVKNDETNDFLTPTKSIANANCTQQLSPGGSTSNLVPPNNENPWKRLSNVRYKLDGEVVNGTNSTRCHQTYAQHITFV